MADLTYFEKLKDPRWQKKRLEILLRDNWACQKCGDDESTLHIHHRVYQKGKEPWEIDNSLLITLCDACHDTEKEQMSKSLNDLNQALKEKFLAMDVWNIMEGFFDIKITQHPEVSARVIKWAISNKKIMAELSSKYFKYLQNDRVEKTE